MTKGKKDLLGPVLVAVALALIGCYAVASLVGGSCFDSGNSLLSASFNEAADSQQLVRSAQSSPAELAPMMPRIADNESNMNFLENPTASFGACLMVMDDSHFLSEWLAYHWLVLPLRHVVVYIDPKSQTSPLNILERFKDYMTIEVVDWTYADAYSQPPKESEGTIHAQPVNRKLVGEQLKFYEDCMKWYKRRNWNSWITLHDTDEFMSINPVARSPGSGVYLDGAPDHTEPGSVMKFLKMIMKDRVSKDGQHTPCLGVPRMQFCTEEDPVTTTHARGLGMKDEDFVTLRYSKFPRGKEGTRAPKDLVYIGGIDRSYVEGMDMLKNGARPHDVLPERCEWHQRREGSPFQIYHYSGTVEQRSFRKDPRGKFGSRPGSPPSLQCGPKPIKADDVKPWLGAFVRAVGVDEARRLLDGVGRVQGWPDYTGPTARTLASSHVSMYLRR